MVGHHHPFVQCCDVEMARDFGPIFRRQPARVVQAHFAVFNIPQQAFPVLRNDGDKICAGLGIIIALQPDRPPMVFQWVVGHWAPRAAPKTTALQLCTAQLVAVSSFAGDGFRGLNGHKIQRHRSSAPERRGACSQADYRLPT